MTEIEITPAVKAKIFLMYMPTVKVKHYTGDIYRLGGYDDIDGEVKLIGAKGREQMWELKGNIQLLLTPLNKITDEHATEIAKLLIDGESEDFKLAGKHEDGESFYFHDKYSPTGYSYIDFYSFDSNIEIGTIDLNKPTERKQSFEAGCLLLAAYDRLRELDYMIHYYGIDLFKAGLAIDKTTIIKP